jgi:hypothetical protein
MNILEKLKRFQEASKAERDREFLEALQLLQGQTEEIERLKKELEQARKEKSNEKTRG